MNTIYMLGSVKGALIDVLDGFATNEAGLKRIAEQYAEDCCWRDIGELPIVVNIEERLVTIQELDYRHILHIHIVERA